MRSSILILVVALTFSCGPPPPAREPVPDEMEQNEQVVDDGQEQSDPPAEPPAPQPFQTMPGACNPTVKLEPDSADPPVAASQQQLETMAGCETGMAVDWDEEHVALVYMEGENISFSFLGVDDDGQGSCTIGMQAMSVITGNPFIEQKVWMVRVPASCTDVKVNWTYASDDWNGPMPY